MKFLVIFMCFVFIRSRLRRAAQNMQYSSDTSSFLIQSNCQSSFANLRLKSSLDGISFGLLNSEFLIKSLDNIALKADSSERIIILSPSTKTESITVNQRITYKDQNQWKLVVSDFFSLNDTDYNGWNFKYITKCSSHTSILGGNCLVTNKELVKTITSLPLHRKVLIEAFYHFIGSWRGETGYLKSSGKFDSNIIWTSRCTYNPNLLTNHNCGYPVCKLNVPIRVTLEHTSDILSLTFGSSINKDILACDKSFGISELRVYIQ